MANYYPIKCPYCLKSHNNSTVRFCLSDAVITADRAAKKPAKSFVEVEPSRDDSFKQGGEYWDTDIPDAEPAFSTGHNTKKDLPTRGYYTVSELYEIFGPENVRVDIKTVLALPMLTSDYYSGNLVTGITITVTEGDRELEKTMRTRYCDCGDDRKLNPSAGSIPSYVILLMGSTDSGKTVYLASLYNALSLRSKYSFPPTSDPDKSFATLWLSVLSEGATALDIGRISEDLFEEGMLPFTTFDMTNEPLTMEVTIKFNKSGLINKVLLFLRDVPGEYFTNRERQQELRKITNQFPKFDGFMIMFDPMAFKEAVFPVEDAETDRIKRRQVNIFKQIIINEVAPTMANNMISQPTAAIITKGDLFFNRNYANALKYKGISYAMPLLTVSQKQSYDKSYFDEVDRGARTVLEKLSENISELMGAHFSNAFFSLVSSLSRNPIDMYVDLDGRRRVGTPNAISPWHVTDPMLRLLMKLKIVPPLDESNARAATGETVDERNARFFRNKSIINEWGSKYCTGGSNVNLV